MRLLFLLIFLPNLAVSHAQSTPSKEEKSIRPHWKAGEKKTYSCSFREDLSFQKDTFVGGGVIYDMEVEVLEANDTGMTLQWRFYNNALIQNGDTTPYNYPKLDSIRYIVKTDANGTFLGIENWQSIGADLSSRYVAMLENTNSSEDMITWANLKLKQYRNQAVFQRVSLHEIGTFFAFFGKGLSQGNKNTFQDTMLNFFSGEPAWHKGEFVVRKSNAPNTLVHAIFQSRIDETPVTEAMYFFLKMRAGMYSNSSISDISAFKPAQLLEFIQFDLDPETGWIVKSDTYRFFTTSDWCVAQVFTLKQK